MNYDSGVPRIAQSDSWSCSVASTCWLLNSLGIGDQASYPSLEVLMQEAGLVSPALGLLTGSGGPLAAWLTERYGLPALNRASITWAWLYEAAGTMPIIIGGHGWYHWVGVREADDGVVLLANPADGWMGVHQSLSQADFTRLGPFSAVYVPVVDDGPEEEDMGKIEELESLVGVLRDAGRVARENIEEALAVPKLPKAARTALESGALPAVATVERGGTPVDEG